MYWLVNPVSVDSTRWWTDVNLTLWAAYQDDNGLRLLEWHLIHLDYWCPLAWYNSSSSFPVLIFYKLMQYAASHTYIQFIELFI